jgi:hypothetical protein
MPPATPTRKERIAQIDVEVAGLAKRQADLYALRDRTAKDIIANRGAMGAKSAERERLVEEESKGEALRQAFAIDAKKPIADALTSRLPQHLSADAFRTKK